MTGFAGRHVACWGEEEGIYRYIPNSLTVLRLGLAVAFPFAPAKAWLAIVVLAALTEFLDGFLARRWSVVSTFGRRLDPVADKVFVGSVLLTLLWHGIFDLPMLGGVIIRDVVVLVGGALAWAFGLHRDYLAVSPKYTGKVATAVQFVFLLVTCALGSVVFELWLFTALASGIAGVDYLVLGLRHLYAARRS